MEKTFTCKTCSKGYKYKRNLTRHLRDSGHSKTHRETICVDDTPTTIEYELEEKTRKNYLKVITIHPKTIVIDPTVFLNNLIPDITTLINNNLKETQSIKFQLSFMCSFIQTHHRSRNRSLLQLQDASNLRRRAHQTNL